MEDIPVGIIIENDNSRSILDFMNVIDEKQAIPDYLKSNLKIFTNLTMCSYGGFEHLSDQRMKENIIPISNALNTINKIKCFEYNFKNNSEIHYGVLAQQIEDIEKLNPLVGKQEVKTVNYMELIPWLIKANQELSEEMNKMNKELAFLFECFNLHRIKRT
jgi:ASC-1-like (ASCH) protein